MLKNKNYSLILLTLLIIIIFGLIVSTSGLIFGRNKTDFTNFHRYTMKPQSQKIASELKSPINITIYMSDNINNEYPSLSQHAQYIMRLLERYQTLGNGNIRIEIKNPTPYSGIEKEAQNNNIRPFTNKSGDENMYLGATFVNKKGEKYTIPYFSVQRQNYAEYDLSRILAKLSSFNQKTVGIMSFAAEINDDWLFVKQIANDYNIININNVTSEIPSEVDVLLVFNPQNLSPLSNYALDQYVLNGGKMIMLVDPFSEVIAKGNPSSSLYQSGIQPLLTNLGLEFDYDLVIGDKLLSQKEKKKSQKESNFVLNVDLTKDYINQNSPLTNDLFKLSFRSPGSLVEKAKGNAIYTPLFFTSKEGGSINAPLARFATPETITNNFQADNKSYVMGYLVEGWFDSLYERNILEGTEFEHKMKPFIIGSIEKSSIMVIADTDFLNDSSWNNTTYQDFAIATDFIPSANNSDFILQAIDYMSNNQNMIGLIPSHLYKTDLTMKEQLYNKIFPKYAKQYKALEQKLIEEENALKNYNQDIRTQKVSFSIHSIKQLEGLNRNIQTIKNELKKLDYIIKLEQEKKVNQLIFYNMIVFPFTLLILLLLGFKLYKRHNKKKVLRLINE